MLKGKESWEVNVQFLKRAPVIKCKYLSDDDLGLIALVTWKARGDTAVQNWISMLDGKNLEMQCT